MKKRLILIVLLGFGVAGMGALAEEKATPTPMKSRQQSKPKFYPLREEAKKTPVRKAKFYSLNSGTPTPSPDPGWMGHKASQPVTAWAPGKKKSYQTLYQDHP
jgi:hypothetical protein